MKPSDDGVEYKRHIRKNNLPYASFMNLRHTWATLAIESGADITLVAKMMGHTNIDMDYKRHVKPKSSAYRSVKQEYQICLTKPQ